MGKTLSVRHVAWATKMFKAVDGDFKKWILYLKQQCGLKYMHTACVGCLHWTIYSISNLISPIDNIEYSYMRYKDHPEYPAYRYAASERNHGLAFKVDGLFCLFSLILTILSILKFVFTKIVANFSTVKNSIPGTIFVFSVILTVGLLVLSFVSFAGGARFPAYLINFILLLIISYVEYGVVILVLMIFIMNSKKDEAVEYEHTKNDLPASEVYFQDEYGQWMFKQPGVPDAPVVYSSPANAAPAIRKYEFTGETRKYGKKEVLYRIRRISDGAIGGWIAQEANLSHEGSCWVGDDAIVSDIAQVRDNAQVYGNASVVDRAIISGDALICDNAFIADDARVSGSSQVFEHAIIFEEASITNEVRVYGNAHVSGKASISYKARVYGYASISGEAVIRGEACICGNTKINDKVQIFGNVQVLDKAVLSGTASLRDNAIVSGKAQITGGYIYGNAQVGGDATVNGHASVYDNAKISGYATVAGDVYGNAQIYGNASIGSGGKVYDNSLVEGSAVIHGKVYGSTHISGNMEVKFDEEIHL